MPKWRSKFRPDIRPLLRKAPLAVLILLIGLGLLTALLAGLEVNQPPIGAVDGGTAVAEYLPADGSRSADKFLLRPPHRASRSELSCVDDDHLTMEGWAADPRDGAPAARVELYVDQLRAGDARVGIARPDVEEYFQRVDFAKSGWQLEVPLRTLSTGYHYMEIWAVDRDGTSRLLLEHRFRCLPPLP
jgi:hypothetical protein